MVTKIGTITNGCVTKPEVQPVNPTALKALKIITTSEPITAGTLLTRKNKEVKITKNKQGISIGICSEIILGLRYST